MKYNLKSFYKSELVNSKGFYTEAEEGEEEVLFKTFPIEKVVNFLIVICMVSVGRDILIRFQGYEIIFCEPSRL